MKVGLPLFLTVSLFVSPSRLDAQTAYDLRTAGPGGVSWVAAVQNQLLLGDCWTFSTATAIDSNLLMNGLLPTGPNPPEIQISSWHLSARVGAPEWLNYNENRGDWEADNGSNGWGGAHWMAMGYLTRGAGQWTVPKGIPGSTVTEMGGGPVLVSQNSLNAFPVQQITQKEDLSATLPPPEQTIDFQTRRVFFWDQKGSGRNQAEQVAAVKSALQTYGALPTGMFTGVKGFEESGAPVLYRGGKKPGHSVAIIGWDDDYVIQGKKGAWIVQNSWGTDWGQNGGLFYASYFDKYIGRLGVMSVQMDGMGNRTQTVLQNELGPLELTGSSRITNNPLGMAVLSKGKTHNTNEVVSVIPVEDSATITGLGLASHVDGAGVSFTIYGGFDPATGPTGSPLYSSSSLNFTGRGYQVFDIETPIIFEAGSQLVVLVDYADRLNAVPYVLGGATGEVGAGLSFYKSPKGWKDFSDLGKSSGVFFLKGITSEETTPQTLMVASAVPEPGVWALLLMSGIGWWVLRSKKHLHSSAMGGTVPSVEPV